MPDDAAISRPRALHEASAATLRLQLTPEGRVLFEAVVDYAENEGLRAFLVGGTVRDLLLGQVSLDVDITIEGDAVALAGRVAEKTGARLAKTTEFGTATLALSRGSPQTDHHRNFRLDLATARAETYARPGALPKVRASTIEDDLLRRDFPINAIALQLTGDARGKLLDPTGGCADLRAGLVRVLHDESFQDDATRLLRAARYETRFGFHIEERTLDLVARDVQFLDRISGTRIRQELQRTFAEVAPERPLARMDELGVLRAIHPALAFRDEQSRTLRTLREDATLPPAVWPLSAWPLLAGTRPPPTCPLSAAGSR